MSSAMIWGAEGVLSPYGAQASILLRETTLDNRLNALRDVAVALLNDIETLRGSEPRGEGELKLDEQVKRFEIDLIRTALDKTGGNQARAARLLGVKHTTLNAKIKRYKIRIAGQGVNGFSREIAA